MTASPTVARRRWTPEQRDQAVHLATEVGAAEAARRLDMPEGTVKSMTARAKVATVASPSVEVATTTEDPVPLPAAAAAASEKPTAPRRQRLVRDYTGAEGTKGYGALILVDEPTEEEQLAQQLAHRERIEAMKREEQRLLDVGSGLPPWVRMRSGRTP